VGVNGAGKTTLIKVLLDFVRPDAGSVRIFGREQTDHRARERLCYLPERFTPPHFMTGREFLRHMAGLHGLRFERAAVEDLFRRLDLDPAVFDRPVRAFSKGMAQKLGLAACLLSERDLLVLDEPMSGLDPRARALLKAYLLARRGRGQTLFFTTHLLHDVEALCTRLAILHQGRIRFVGTPDECKARYDTDDLEQAYLRAIGNE
jgi:ABC-2 type transport system ATP-binding protein